MDELLDVHGIILSSAPAGEADRRLVLLTKELGKISVFARGARKPTSTMVGSTRPFACGTFGIYPGKSAYALHRAEISEYFEEIVMDMTRAAYGCSFLELAGYFSRENVPEETSLSLLIYSLRALLNRRIPNTLVQPVFELRTLMENGLVPDLLICRKCKRPLLSEDGQGQGYFLRSVMGCCCPECKEHSTEGLPLSGSTLQAVRYIRETEPNRMFRFLVDENTLEELRSLTEALLSYGVDRTLPAREMLKVLTEN